MRIAGIKFFLFFIIIALAKINNEEPEFKAHNPKSQFGMARVFLGHRL
jgi:hypothetical protein